MTSERASSFCPSVAAVCRHSDSYLWSPSPALVKKKSQKKPNKHGQEVFNGDPPSLHLGLGAAADERWAIFSQRACLAFDQNNFLDSSLLFMRNKI